MIPEVLSRQRRGVEREGRRRRRREARERGGRLEGDGEEHRQGMSSDDELLEMNRLKFENSMCELSLSSYLCHSSLTSCLTPVPSYTHSLMHPFPHAPIPS